MEASHLDQLIELENSYWWHVAKRQIATDLLRRYVPRPSRIVEGGIGAGGNLLAWQAQGYHVTGLDVMPESIAHARQLGLQDVHAHDLHLPWPVEKHAAGAVVMLDVLEHLADPVQALRHAADSLSEAGKIIFTVPAYPFLFSDWDQRLGHYRRYTRSMMRDQVQQAGLKLQTLRHWNSFTLPAALLLRSLRKWRPSAQGTEFPKVSKWLNSALIRSAAIENRLAAWCGVPCGLSLVGVISR